MPKFLALILFRRLWPSHTPASAGMTASVDSARSSRCRDSWKARPTVRATVETVKDRPRWGTFAKGVRATVGIWANTAAVSEFLLERLAPWMAAQPQVGLDIKERQKMETLGIVPTTLPLCAPRATDFVGWHGT
ncbi:hypothetical protein GV68_17740 [Pseudorhizobium pelagicum]|uniref:Uncharacterized protein n=1 Tax=Pseudorhizobium pelagicum TaxID=1509405 RepID=A0A922T6W9_9HYPH|nr:hypothetical protein GV68_17740 [Pseudorhizobium pelagicum]